MSRTKRCPLHPDGCSKHPNPSAGRPGRPGNPARRDRPQPLRGSYARYLMLVDADGRRRLIDRPAAGAS